MFRVLLGKPAKGKQVPLYDCDEVVSDGPGFWLVRYDPTVAPGDRGGEHIIARAWIPERRVHEIVWVPPSMLVHADEPVEAEVTEPQPGEQLQLEGV